MTKKVNIGDKLGKTPIFCTNFEKCMLSKSTLRYLSLTMKYWRLMRHVYNWINHFLKQAIKVSLNSLKISPFFRHSQWSNLNPWTTLQIVWCISTWIRHSFVKISEFFLKLYPSAHTKTRHAYWNSSSNNSYLKPRALEAFQRWHDIWSAYFAHCTFCAPCA